MDIKEYTTAGIRVSLQVSALGDIPAGTYEPGRVFLLKNITDNNITVEVLPASSDTWLSTVLYSGWNPELVKGVRGVTTNTLQYGY